MEQEVLTPINSKFAAFLAIAVTHGVKSYDALHHVISYERPPPRMMNIYGEQVLIIELCLIDEPYCTITLHVRTIMV